MRVHAYEGNVPHWPLTQGAVARLMQGVCMPSAFAKDRSWLVGFTSITCGALISLQWCHQGLCACLVLLCVCSPKTVAGAHTVALRS